jgi:hypothetical protein
MMTKELGNLNIALVFLYLIILKSLKFKKNFITYIFKQTISKKLIENKSESEE